MTPAVADRPRLFTESPGRLGSAGALRPRERSDGGRLTLEQRLDGVWEGLRAGGVAECPVCHGRMTSPEAALPGRCGDCGATLA